MSAPSLDEIAARLERAGFSTNKPLSLDVRDERVAARLAGDRIAWFPRSDEGRAALRREARVLRLLETHCGFQAPRVLHEDTDGWQVRSFLAGEVDAFGLWERTRGDGALARRLGDALGAILADQHMHVPASALVDWLPTTPSWPRAEDFANVSRVTNDASLLRRIDRALTSAATEDFDAQPVLVHADLGFHNLAFDAVRDAIVGVFDYDGAACADRHHDFKYLLLQTPDEALLEAAIAAYEPLTGAVIDRARVRLLNALCAIGFLGFRNGHAPDEKWCGRTFAEDMAWTDTALSAAGL